MLGLMLSLPTLLYSSIISAVFITPSFILVLLANKKASIDISSIEAFGIGFGSSLVFFTTALYVF
jgi:hypothetical protein